MEFRNIILVSFKKWHRWVGLGFFAFSFCLAWLVGLDSPGASMSFFGAGGMLLIGGLLLFRARLGKAGGEENVITKISPSLNEEIWAEELVGLWSQQDRWQQELLWL